MEGFPVTARGGYDERMLFKIKINDPNLAKNIVLYRKKSLLAQSAELRILGKL